MFQLNLHVERGAVIWSLGKGSQIPRNAVKVWVTGLRSSVELNDMEVKKQRDVWIFGKQLAPNGLSLDGSLLEMLGEIE